MKKVSQGKCCAARKKTGRMEQGFESTRHLRGSFGMQSPYTSLPFKVLLPLSLPHFSSLLVLNADKRSEETLGRGSDWAKCPKHSLEHKALTPSLLWCCFLSNPSALAQDRARLYAQNYPCWLLQSLSRQSHLSTTKQS